MEEKSNLDKLAVAKLEELSKYNIEIANLEL